MSFYAVILAGGSGSRLWPLSKSSMPKQFLSLNDKRTMLQETVERLTGLISLQNIYIVTFAKYVSLVREQLPELPYEQIIVEPTWYGTAAAIGLAATHIMIKDPKAVMGSFAADLIFDDKEQFFQALRFANGLASQGYLVTLAVEPNSAETGYSYIQVGEFLRDNGRGIKAFKILQFINKPSREQADTYIRAGGYTWHTGVSVWRVDRILEEIREHVTGIGEILDAIGSDMAHKHGDEVRLNDQNRLQENISIEIGVLEKAGNVVVIPLHVRWSDIGSWKDIAALYPPDEHENRIHMLPSGHYSTVDTHNTFIYSTTGRTIATIGVKDLIIVDTDEALLICHKNHVQLVGKVPGMLAKESEAGRRPIFSTDKFTIDFLALSSEGFTIQTRQSLLRHAPNTPLPAAKRICVEKDHEQKKYRVGKDFAPIIGIRDPYQIGNRLSFDIYPVTFPTYSAIDGLTDAHEALSISNAGATAIILLTTEYDGSHRILVQYRSRFNRFYSETPGASVAGFIDGKLDPANRGRLLPVDTHYIKSSAIKEMSEELQLSSKDIVNLRIVGLAQDKVKVHTEFLLLSILKQSADEIAQNADILNIAEPDDEYNFTEKFFAINGTPETIEILLTQVMCPLPPTHSAAFTAAGYLLILERSGLEAADEWKNRLEKMIQANYQKIDQMVEDFYNDSARKRGEDAKNQPKLRALGFNPAYSPTAQGLPDVVSEFERVGLI